MARFDSAMLNLDMMARAGKMGDPLYQDYYRRSLLGGSNGAKAQGILENLLAGPSILAGLTAPAEPPEPELDPKRSLFIGHRHRLRRMTGIPRQLLTTHLLVQGATGCGKTNAEFFIINQLVEAGVRVIFHDHKNEGRRLLRRHSGVVALRICDFRENFLKPVGDPKAYFTTFWSEFGRSYRVRRETVVKLIGFAIRVAAGQRPGDPYPSLQDFACLLRAFSQSERDSSLDTAATALESLNATLGECATVRDGPCADDLFDVVVVQCHGLPSEFLQFFMGIRLYRAHVGAIGKGHTGELTSVIISDEGGLEFAREVSSEAGSGHISPQKRLISQIRSTGTGLIIATQSLSAIDPAVIANVASVLCMRAQSDADVRISGRLLGLPEERLSEVRNIPRWSGLFKSPLHEQGVLVDIPKVDMGEYISDAELERRNRPALDTLNARAVFSPARNDVPVPISYRDILGETTPTDAKAPPSESCDIRDEHRSFVAEIVAHPDSGVVEHYHNLRWSAGRGSRVKNELVEGGILETQRQRSVNGRPVERLVLTEKGRQVFHDHA